MCIRTINTYLVDFRDGSYLWLSMLPTANMQNQKTLTMLPSANRKLPKKRGLKKVSQGVDKNHPRGVGKNHPRGKTIWKIKGKRSPFFVLFFYTGISHMYVYQVKAEYEARLTYPASPMERWRA